MMHPLAALVTRINLTPFMPRFARNGEKKPAKMIVEVKADKDRLKMENESPTLETQ